MTTTDSTTESKQNKNSGGKGRAKLGEKEISKAVRKIRAYWKRGRASLRQLKKGGYREGAIKEAAKALGWSEPKLRKSRQFADPRGGYTEDQLDALIRLLQKHPSNFGVSHVGLLVTVSWKKGRAKLQRRCIQGNWGKAQVQTEINRLLGKRRQGGRKRRVATDACGLMVQFDNEGDTWQRLIRAASEADGDGCRLDRLPRKVRLLLDEVTANVARLREALAVSLEEARNTAD